MLFERPAPGHVATLVSVRFPRRAGSSETAAGYVDHGDEHRAEFEELVRSAALRPAALVTAARDKPHPRWFVGTGKVDELEQTVAATRSDLVIFNHELAPAQQRNLEERLACRVMTRTELILHIFAERARTHEGKLQVELAQLTHAQTRLVRGWTHLDRQTGVGGAGGRSGSGGRIGGAVQRGAGETQLEMDQRMLRERIRQVRSRLDSVQRRRVQSRRRRSRGRTRTVALAGYTNAGKSTLFNALTGGSAVAADRLFATLDPTMRRIQGTDAEIVLADTVGFIRDLPVALVDAFKATLEEVSEADLVLHVMDASAADAEDLRREVHAVLGEIGASEVPRIEVLNKIDLVADPGCVTVGQVAVSATTGEGLPALREAVFQRLGLDTVSAQVRVPAGGGRMRSWLYAHGEVSQERVDDVGDITLEVRLNRDRLGELADYNRAGLAQILGQAPP